jgi:tetratricopeptide (TPR) repeat protein/DNA-binding transcriptional ArsR family regulator
MEQEISLQRSELILRLISDERTRKILSILSSRPAGPREIASSLGIQETRVSEKIRLLLDAGLIKDEGWRRSDGRNTKVYSILFRSVELNFLPEGCIVKLSKQSGSKGSVILQETKVSSGIPEINFDFIGREKYVEQILSSREPLLIFGLPGIGKTTLASICASKKDKTSVFWHTFNQHDTIQFLLLRVASFLSSNGRKRLSSVLKGSFETFDDVISAAVTELQSINSFLVFDDCHTVKDKDLISFLQAIVSSGLVVILLSREKLEWLNGMVKEIELEPFTDREAEEFVLSRKGFFQRAILEEAKNFSFHPMALELLCSSSRKISRGKISFESYLDKSIFSAFKQKELFMLKKASIFELPFTQREINALIPSRSRGWISRGLERLENKGIVKKENNEYMVHELIRRSVLKRFPPDELDHSRLASIYSQSNQGRKLIEAIRHAQLSRQYELIINIMKDDMPILDQGYISNYQTLLHSLYQTVRESRIKAWIKLTLARILYNRDERLDESLHMLDELAQESSRLLDDYLVFRIMHAKAQVYKRIGRIEEAEKILRDALSMARGRIEKRFQKGAMELLVELMMYRNKFSEALYLQKELMRVVQQDGRSKDVLNILGNRGLIFYLAGDLKTAIKWLRIAVRGLLKLGDVRDAGLGMYNLALAYEDSGDLKRALRLLDNATTHLSYTEVRSALLEVLSEKMVVKSILGINYIDDMDEAEELSRIVGRKDSMGVFETAMGFVLMLEGKEVEAYIRFKRAEELLSFTEFSLARMMWLKGYSEMLTNKIQDAYSSLIRSAELFRKIGSEGHEKRIRQIISSLPLRKTI